MSTSRCIKDKNKCWLVAIILSLFISLNQYQKIGSIPESIGYFLGTTLIIFAIIFIYCFSWHWNKTDIQNPQDRNFVIRMGIMHGLLLLIVLYGLVKNITTQSTGNALCNAVMLIFMILLGRKLYKLLF